MTQHIECLVDRQRALLGGLAVCEDTLEAGVDGAGGGVLVKEKVTESLVVASLHALVLEVIL